MTVPTVSELALLREHPHNTRLWLSVYQPEIAVTANVSGTHAKGSRSISYDGASWSAGWSYNKINNGMTMLVGSAVGDESKGRIRVRSAINGTLTVAENSHIDWADNDVLTILNFYEINAVYPRIIQDPGDETQTLWYKDYDIAYNGQNTALGSFICMGPHYAGFTGTVYYTASGTYNLKGETLSYHWLFEGGNPTGSSSFTPGKITYATPGHYTTQLIVSGTSAGSVDRSYRHVSIYNRPENGSGAELPILSWELQDLSGSRDQGGYTADIRIYQDLSLIYSMGGDYKPIIREGDLVVLFAEDWYGNTPQSLGGNAIYRSETVFVGYILRGSVQYNYRDSYVDFSVGSPTEIMKMAEGFSISIQDNADPETATDNPDIPSGWVTVLNMDIKRAIYHYLRWHTTALNCCDVIFKGTDRALQYFDADRTSIYDAINTLLQGAWMGKASCDRQGALYCERDVYIEPSAYLATFELNSKDWMDDITIEQARQEHTSFIELGGVAYSGSTGTYTALLSQAPGTSPSYRGTAIRQQGLALISQSELNNMSGALWKHKNLIYPNVDVKLAGNYRNFDVAPQEKIPLTVALTDTVRGISFTQKPFYLDRMQWSYDPKLEIFLPMASFTELVTGSFAGDTVTIPDMPPTTGDSGGFYIPPIEIPSITIPPFPTVSVGGADFMWYEGNYGYSESDYTSLFIPALFTAGNYGYGYVYGLIPFGNNGSANVYAVISRDAQFGARTWYMNVITKLLDGTTVTNYGSVGPFTTDFDTSGQYYMSVGPVVIANDGGHMIEIELEYEDTNTLDAYFYGAYIQW